MAAEAEVRAPALNLQIDPFRFQPTLDRLSTAPLLAPVPTRRVAESEPTGPAFAPLLREVILEDFGGIPKGGFVARHEFGIQLLSNF
jgi:hypothetical protein